MIVRLCVLLGLMVLGAGCPNPMPGQEDDDSGSSDGTEGSSGGTDGTSPSTGSEVDTQVDDTSTAPVCGNGIVEEGEQCDGDALAGGTCEELGLGAGTLACDAGCSYDASECSVPLEVPVLELSFSQVKRFDFSWAAVAGAEHYQLLESLAPGEPYAQLGEDIVGESVSFEMPLHGRFEASYVLRACDGRGCTDSAVVDVVGSLAEAVGYVKASNTEGDDYFGQGVALSGDGNTLAVGAPFEASNATGIDGNQANESASGSGAVYVFVRDGAGAWSQQAYVKASNTGASDWFGWSVALSEDGSTLAVGAFGEASSATGIGGNQTDGGAPDSGAVYVFVRGGAGVWSQQAYVKASNTGAFDQFGSAVALSGDGDTLAVGALGEASSATGIGGNQADDSAEGSGAVYVLVRDGAGVWSQQAYVKASNTATFDRFGWSVALSGDGSTLAVGAPVEDSSATGIGGNQADDSAGAAGAVYVFVRDGAGVWSQQAYVKASNTAEDEVFGIAVALSGDGNTLAVGAPREDSNATGIGGNQADDDAANSGAAYVFVRAGAGAWSQQAYVKASNTGPGDDFGTSVALSGDGNMLAVGAPDEASIATGIGGDRADDELRLSGAVYVLVRDGAGAWSQQAYVKASNTGSSDWFGTIVALSGDGSTLAVGAPQEQSIATGIGGDQTNDSAFGSGAVYLY